MVPHLPSCYLSAAKCYLVVTQQRTYLGVVCGSKRAKVYMLEVKLKNPKRLIEEGLNDKSVSNTMLEGNSNKVLDGPTH